MDKQEFFRRLECAAERVLKVAQTWVDEDLSPSLLFNLPEYDDPTGRRAPVGMLKYFGGRFVTPGDLKHLRAWRAASMLWVDGKVPAWVDVSIEGVYEDYSVVGVRCSTELLAFDEDKLPNDLPEYVDPGDSIKPFRTRGIAIPGIVGALPASGRIRMARIMAIRMRGTPCVETYVIVPRPED